MEHQPPHEFEDDRYPLTPLEVVRYELERRGITALDVLAYLEELEVAEFSSFS